MTDTRNAESRFEEKAVLDECLQLGIRMIPEGMAGFIPIAFEKSGPAVLDGVLIDDNSLVRRTWEMAAKTSGNALRAFPHPSAFLDAAGGIAKATPIYVDSKLGGARRDEEFAKELRARGFRNLYLATARAPSPRLPRCRGSRK